MLSTMFFIINLNSEVHAETRMASPDDFYLYVSSRLNRLEFKENRSCAFTNIIAPFIKLDGMYEVAVANIILPQNIPTIKRGAPEYFLDFEIFTSTNIVPPLKITWSPTADIGGDEIESLITNIDRDIVNWLIDEKKIMLRKKHELHNTMVTYQKSQKFVKFFKPQLVEPWKSEGFFIQCLLSPSLTKLFGFKSDFFTEIPEIKTAPAMPTQSEMLFLNTDIVTPSYFGGQTVHLLNMFSLERNIARKFQKDIYKKVAKTSIDSISFKLTNQDGECFDFGEDSHVFIVLHFKRESI